MRQIFVAILLLLAVPLAVAAEPTRESLLTAWESLQRADPQTRTFERINDGRYRFATERFPFDGELEIAEVVVDDRSAEIPYGSATGHVAATLVGIDDAFRERYATSLAIWHSDGILHWDDETQGWVGSRAWMNRLQERHAGGLWGTLLSNGFWILLLVVLILSIWPLSRRANRQFEEASAQQALALSNQRDAIESQRRAIDGQQEAIELIRESNRLLREIRDQLAQRS